MVVNNVLFRIKILRLFISKKKKLGMLVNYDLVLLCKRMRHKWIVI
jgi:hypothetical protein